MRSEVHYKYSEDPTTGHVRDSGIGTQKPLCSINSLLRRKARVSFKVRHAFLCSIEFLEQRELRRYN